MGIKGKKLVIYCLDEDYDPSDDCGTPYCCEYCPGQADSIKLEDAIERMAKGIARQYDPDRPNAKEYERIWDEELLDRVKQSFRKKAEAALNSLLEGKK